MTTLKPGTWVRRKGEKYPHKLVLNKDELLGDMYSVNGVGVTLDMIEPAPLDPKEYIGCFGAFWDSDNNMVLIGRLDGVIDGYGYEMEFCVHGDYFTPCEIVPTNPELITPDKFLIFGPDGKVIQ